MLATRNRPFWICTLLLFGSYLPTSDGEITKGWTRLALFGVCLILFILQMSDHGRAKGDLLSIAFLIVFLPLLFTPFSLLPVPVYGILGAFAIFSLLISVRLENVSLTNSINRTFLLVNIINVLLGAGIVLRLSPVQQFLITYYSAHYPDLVPSMLELGKPVLTYATHSLAGFVLYLFFWVNLRGYQQTRRKLHLFFCIIYMIFMLALLSVSGVLFFCAAFIQLMWLLLRRAVVVAVLSAGLVVLTMFATLRFLGGEGAFSDGFFSGVTDILSAGGSGFLGRYVTEGSLQPAFDYLAVHPFRPVGLKSEDELPLLDSGPLDYYMRGSIVLVVLVYAGFYLFLKRNLHNRKDAYFLFFVTVGFELGFSALTSFRVVCLLPVLIVYLNGVRVPSPQRAAYHRVLAVEGA